MSSYQPFEVSPHSINRNEMAKNVNKPKTFPVNSVKVKTIKKKGAAACEGKKGVPKKTIQNFPKKTAAVQIIDPTSKLSKKNEFPVVKIKNETSCINVVERIKCAAGLRLTSSQLPPFSSDAINIPTCNLETKLNQPQFQSSVVLMKDLDKLKTLAIETQSLLHKSRKDVIWKKSLLSKVSSVLNARPSEVIFSRLQPISFNVEQLMNSDEIRLQDIAEKYAPKKRSKDPEICLKDFLPSMVIEKIPILAQASFLEQCNQYLINPFNQLGVPEKHSIIPYIFWIQ